MLTAVSRAITAQATTWAELRSKCRRQWGKWAWAAMGNSSPNGNWAKTLASPKLGTSTPRYLAKAIATAALKPVWMTRNCVQPKRKAQKPP